MRELLKTAFRFSWSLPLFGVQQLVNLLTPAKATGAFENASEAMEHQLGGVLQAAFKTGDSLQRGIVDLTVGGLARRSPVPGRANASSAQTVQPAGAPPARALQAPGWGPMPYPVVVPSSVSPTAPGPGTTSQPATETNISPNYPFEPHYIEVLGSRMHYVDVGSGDPILFLHGNPEWSYSWRNVIPHLEPLGRCIAPDLIGFGRSDKPEIEYRWVDHVRYVETFIEKMGLRNMIMVIHDQGSGLGFHYAMRNQDNVRGLAFFEAIIRPYPWDQFSTPDFREIFRRFRTGGVGGEGWQMIVDQNVFIEQLLPQAAGRPLTETEMNYYREPFTDPISRIPIWRFPRETPIGGQPRDVWDAVSAYSARLQRSALPKLLLYATPGALVTKEQLEWAKRNIKNLKTVYLGFGLHFLHESSPHRIGREIAKWMSALPPATRTS
jgi:haloalkane dehalogenase